MIPLSNNGEVIKTGKKPTQNIVLKGHLVDVPSFSKISRKDEKMRNSLQKRLAQKGWTGKQVSAFLEKHGIKRSWKTILEEIKNSRKVFLVKKIGGYVILPDDTVKKYIDFIIRTKKIKKKDGSMANAENLIRDICLETKERLDEEKREEKSKEDVFRGEIVNCSGDIDDRIIAQQGRIKMIRRF